MKVYLTFFRSLKAIGAGLESKHTLKIRDVVKALSHHPLS